MREQAAAGSTAAAQSSPGAESIDGHAPLISIRSDVLERHPPLEAELQRDRGSWIAALALEHALRQARLTRGAIPPERVGLVMGSALAGQRGMIQFAEEVRAQSARFVSPIHFPNTVGNYTAGALARAYQLRGPNLTLAGGSACGLQALVQGAAWVGNDSVDYAIAGGVEAFWEGLIPAIAADNVPLIDGACLFILERSERAINRGVTVLAYIERLPPWIMNDAGAFEFDHGADIVVTAGFGAIDATGIAPGLNVPSSGEQPRFPFVRHGVSVESVFGCGLAATGAAAVALAIQHSHDHRARLAESASDSRASGLRDARAIVLASTGGSELLAVKLTVPAPPHPMNP